MSIQIQQVIDNIRQELQVDFIGIALSRVSAGTNLRTIHWKYVSGNTNENYKRIRLQVGRGIAGIVWRTGRSYCEMNLQDDPKELVELPIARMEKIETAVAAPILKNGRVQGVLLFGYRRPLKIENDFLKEVEARAEQLLVLLEEA
ncbi:GAF domain-containing protein [Enterococcus sp. BWR-S5]|uniref:GAF domain-containing protein n=1 Tax=Enterococcus sp. BWR-S5 TaxID=2787714 RepID=UPI001920D90B|nr:GAF domain-containing protein [Enterococcus sp. BWR-S5]MBL1224870.1 GAF domain-containing protein [Enterococcus sp. BWR-S5]